ncbi:ion channel [Thermomonas sp.]|uniref:ion channel n=1 Tax=Thermomonas sp. TaxID=1971895 RepID=UPI003D141FB1
MIPTPPVSGFGGYALAALVTLAVTALVVLMHYRGLEGLARRYSGRRHPRHRSAMLVIIFALLGLHVLEIACYGVAYWGLDQLPGIGLARGAVDISLFDGVYLSAMAYSTVSFGDISPDGALRVMAGMEAIAGLMLIAWSASFTYLEMARLWQDRGGPE